MDVRQLLGKKTILPRHSCCSLRVFLKDLKSLQSYVQQRLAALLQILELSNVDWQLHEAVVG